MKNRNQSLDVLRGIAVLLVLGRHMDGAGLWSSARWCGVDLFFVLSGFLISGLLFTEFQKTGTIELKRFWIRRAFKIYPPFYFLLAVTAVFFLLGLGRTPKQILGDIFFLQGYFPHIWEHGWSLAVEEHFYILLPLLFLMLLRTFKNLRATPFISIAASIICLGLRILALRRGVGWAQINYPTHLRIDALFAGVTIGYFAHFDSDSFAESRTVWFPIMGIFLVAIGILFPVFPIGLTLLYVGFACLVAWAANRPESRNPLLGLAALTGVYSYSIYLWHPVVALACYRVPQHWWRFPVYVGVAVVSGVGMAKLIELPAIKLRETFFPRIKSVRIGPAAELENTVRTSLPCTESVT